MPVKVSRRPARHVAVEGRDGFELDPLEGRLAGVGGNADEGRDAVDHRADGAGYLDILIIGLKAGEREAQAPEQRRLIAQFIAVDRFRLEPGSSRSFIGVLDAVGVEVGLRWSIRRADRSRRPEALRIACVERIVVVGWKLIEARGVNFLNVFSPSKSEVSGPSWVPVPPSAGGGPPKV